MSLRSSAAEAPLHAPHAAPLALSDRLLQRQRLINQALDRALAAPPGAPAPFHEAMRYCVLGGGKRYRPLLCLGAAQALGAQPRRALPVACAVELIHAYSLVHDDLPAMDNAAERRGQPSCHRRFGEAAAILVGDALLTRAFELLATLPGPRAAAVVGAIASAGGTTGLIGGQVMDIELAQRGARDGEHTAQAIMHLEEIARRKTAALITASVVAGGLAADARDAQLARLRRYGQRIGLAFQQIDDAHDGDGLARVTSAEALAREATRSIAQATAELTPFGARAWLLRELAEWLASTAR